MIKQKSNKAKAWYIVFMNAFVGCCIAATFPQFSMTIGELSVESGITESVLLTSDTIKSCGIVLSMLLSGLLYNRFRAKSLFVYSMLAAITPQILFPHLDTAGHLIILKFIQGTSSLIFPVFLVIIMNWVDEKDTGLSTAIFNGIFYGGGGIGGTIAGFVIANSDWVMSYYAMAILQLAVGVIWLITVKEKPPGMALQPTGKHEVAEVNKKKPNLLLTGKVWLLSLSFFATTWAVQAITVDMSVFARDIGYSELEIGKLLTSVTIGLIVSCLISGKISDYFAMRAKRKDVSRLTVLIFGYIVTIFAVAFINMANTSNFTIFYIAALLITFGGSWGLGAFYSILPEIYDKKTVPVATGITGGIGDAGMPVSPLVVGVFFGIRGLWNIGWSTCAIMAGISIFTILILIISIKKEHIGKRNNN